VTTEYPASPTPISERINTSVKKVGARPEPKVAALQTRTASAASWKRGRRSPSQPATGDIIA